MAQIALELPAFADYLCSRPADRTLAGNALDTPAKRLLQQITQTAIEEVAHAFRDGHLAYFIEHRPIGTSGMERGTLFDGRDLYIRDSYRAFLTEAVAAAEAGKKHVVSYDHLFAVFELLVGHMPSTKAKLTRRLGHQGMAIIPHTKGGTSQRGYGIQHAYGGCPKGDPPRRRIWSVKAWSHPSALLLVARRRNRYRVSP